MDPELSALLRPYRAGDGQDFTHITHYGPAGKWSIESNGLQNFWKTYCQMVSESPNGLYCLAERSIEKMPVIASLSMKFDYTANMEDPYSDDFIMAVVRCYQRVIVDTLQVPENPIQTNCCVLEPDEPIREGNIVIFNFAIQFPYCKTDVSYQSRILRPTVIEMMRAENVFSRLAYQPINNLETIIDARVPQDPWTMYGSSSSSNKPKLKLTHIYGSINPSHLEDEEEPPERELCQVFNPVNHSHVTQHIIQSTMFMDSISGEIDHDFWLPMFLSVNFWNSVSVSKENVSQHPGVRVVHTRTSDSPRNSSPQSASDDPADIADHLLPCLNIKRVQNDHYWIALGKSLYNIYNGGEKGLMDWIHLTERSDEHDQNECRQRYPMFRNDNSMDVKTLAWFAREDSPEAYNSWHANWCYPAIVAAANSSDHTDVAEALYRVNWLEYVCSSLEGKKFYHFVGHRWVALDSGVDLKKNISGDFRKRFEILRTKVSQDIQDSDDQSFKETSEQLVKKITSLIKKLKTVTYKSQIMKEAMEKFHDPNFDTNADRNFDLMGLPNGILEATKGYITVREGKPQDYVTKSMYVYWDPTMSWEHPMVKRVMYWFHQVFPDNDLFNYAWKLFSMSLRGGNTEKLFPILTGEGNNSKSMVKKLFEAVLGDTYCVTIPTSALTGKRAASGAPQPELAQANHARMAWFQEPDDDDNMRNGTIKEFTGNDKQFVRTLHDKGGAVEPPYTIYMMCNKVPMIPHADLALKARTMILPFPSKFSDKAPETEAEQFAQRHFKIDLDFSNKIPEMAAAALWILVQYYQKYLEEGLVRPQMVLDATENYWKENDIYNQFSAECITPVYLPGSTTERDASVKMTVAAVYQEFRFWFKETFPGVKIPDRSIMKSQLAQRWGKPNTAGWLGIQATPNVAQVNL